VTPISERAGVGKRTGAPTLVDGERNAWWRKHKDADSAAKVRTGVAGSARKVRCYHLSRAPRSCARCGAPPHSSPRLNAYLPATFREAGGTTADFGTNGEQRLHSAGHISRPILQRRAAGMTAGAAGSSISGPLWRRYGDPQWRPNACEDAKRAVLPLPVNSRCCQTLPIPFNAALFSSPPTQNY